MRRHLQAVIDNSRNFNLVILAAVEMPPTILADFKKQLNRNDISQSRAGISAY